MTWPGQSRRLTVSRSVSHTHRPRGPCTDSECKATARRLSVIRRHSSVLFTSPPPTAGRQAAGRGDSADTRFPTVGSRACWIRVRSVHLRGMTVPFVSDRNLLWTPSVSSVTSNHFFSQSYRPVMFSVECCYLHPSQVSVCYPF